MTNQRARRTIVRTPEQVEELRKAMLRDPRILADIEQSEEQERKGKPFEPWPAGAE